MADAAVTKPLLVVEEIQITEEERRRYQYVNRIDIVGTPVIVVWYFVLSNITSQDVDVSSGSPATLLTIQAILAVFSCMAFFYHTQTWPTKKDDDIFHAMKYIGRWLFLTRHCLALQAVHMVLSCYGAAMHSNYFQRLTYGSTFWIGSLGVFVTVQFFMLVHNNPEYVAKCNNMMNKRGFFGLLEFRQYMAALHMPALPLAVCDAVFAKRHSRLHEGAGSLLTTGCMMLFYTAFYIGLVWCNYFATGYFPYAVLKELKTVVKWTIFMLVQTLLLVVFVACLWGLTFLPQPWF